VPLLTPISSYTRLASRPHPLSYQALPRAPGLSPARA
jgi:hypothetical protein